MARTKGTKNREGHKAGGARKGAGRKRKPSTERVSEDEESADIPVDAGPSSIPDNYVDVNQIHPALKQYLNMPHHVPLVVTPVLHSRETLSESIPNFRLSYAAWDSASADQRAAFSADTQSPTTYNSQSLAPPTPSQDSAPLNPSLIAFSQRSTSDPAHPDITLVESLPPLPTITHTEHSQESPPDFEQEQQLETPVQDMQQPDASAPGVATAQRSSSSRTTATCSRFANIAPAPLQQQQRSWMFPYPLPAIMSAPFHRLAIVSQGSSSKRRRRRCAVCIQLGKEEASYDCPGRGDRSRCPYSRKRDEVADMPSKRRRKLDHHPRESEILNSSGSKSSNSLLEGGSPFQPIAPAPSQSSVLVPLTHYGQPVQHFVLSSGETAKRRARRCMVCVARGKDGTSCAGRGSRTWCPDYDKELDARTTKWPLLDKEEEEPEPEES